MATGKKTERKQAEKTDDRKRPAKGNASAEVDGQLERYRSMRDFSTTHEPSGDHATKRTTAPAGLPFVIQKHAATRLHYDFRLGWRGVLKSWAVAKGPSYGTRDRRLAVEVEDHPMEYGGFEGTIPKGQYGGGTVMVWDQGVWEPDGDADEGLRKGSLKFTLHGDKLRGRWTLVRMNGRAAQEAKPNWLLIKEHDGEERAADAPAVVDELPNSVVTGRSLEQIAAAEDHVWQSHAAANTGKPRSRLQSKLAKAGLHGTAPAARKRAKQPPATQSTAQAWLDEAPGAAMPGFIPPQLASASTDVPTGGGWLHELKLDGYRIQAQLRRTARNRVQLFTRSGLDWTHRMKAIASALAALKPHDAVIDGEVVVLDADGRSSFAKLQAAFEQGEKARFTYFAFDLLHLDGHDLRGLPLERRKSLLASLVNGTAGDVRLSEHLALPSHAVYARACELGAEGILSKRADAPYVSGRTRSWLKLKCTHRQEFVIAGFTLPKDGGNGIGSLLLGYWQDGELVHCGRCGTGFTQASARRVRGALQPLRQEKPAYDSKLSSMERKDANWVKPELVCEVEFATWTADGSLRHASFQGLRDDKPADEVTRERAINPTKVTNGQPAAATENAPPKTASHRAGKRVSSAAAKRLIVATPAAKKAASAARLTHPERVLDAASGVTKQQLAAYFEAVAAAMLPHLRDRPVSIVRCPEGTEKPCFFQKHRNRTLPAAIDAIPVPEKVDAKHVEDYIAVQTSDALVSLAQLGVLELHPWGSQSSALEKPDRLIFDLDPDEALAWSTVVDSALEVREFLAELGLEAFVKTTGGKGLHVVAAIKPRTEWPEIKLFARGVAAAIESSNPKLYLIKMTKAARKGRIFLDWMRNERGATAIAPWSPRARVGMRVAVPLSWAELRDGPPRFAVANWPDWRARLQPKKNPWAAMQPQTLRAEVLEAVLQQSAAGKHAQA